MNDFFTRVGSPAPAVARTRTEVAPPRLRNLLRDVLVDDHDHLGGYQVLAEEAGVFSSDAWTEESGARRLHELVESVDWAVVYTMLEKSAPAPMSGLDGYDERVNAVLAREGIAYEMRDGEFGPFDPEGEGLGLNLANPLEEAGEKFQSVYAQYQRALDALFQMKPNALAAISESVNAVEALARILAHDSKATLGKLLPGLIGGSDHRKALAASMSALYGYASTVPGARHGEHETVKIDFPEAAYVVRSAGAAIAMLLAEHRS